MSDTTDTDAESVVIKKYANRRLYNTQSSSYITLDDLAGMVRQGVDFQVLDAKSGNDITHSILTQIIMEEEANGEHMLPVSFLRQLIGMYGNSMQAMMPPYLEAAMANFNSNRASLQDAFTASMDPQALTRMAEQNMAMFTAAANAFMPNSPPAAASGEPVQPPSTKSEEREDITSLRAQMEEMQRKLDQLSK